MSGMVMNVRRARVVMWITHEAEKNGWVRSDTEAAMRAKVARDASEARMIRLVSMDKVPPGDPEFDQIMRDADYAPPDASPWVSVWEVVG